MMQAMITFRFRPGVEATEVFGLVPAESARNWELYAAGIFRQSWLFDDLSGAIALVEVADVDEARAIADSFPMSKAGFLDTEVVPLRPYLGIEELFAKPFTPQRLSAMPGWPS